MFTWLVGWLNGRFLGRLFFSVLTFDVSNKPHFPILTLTIE